MSYRNALLRPPKVNPPVAVEMEPASVPNNNAAPAAAAPPLNTQNRNNNNANNNANWLQQIKINTPSSEPEPFRNVNFPSPPPTPGPENNNVWNKTESELTEEQKRLLNEDPAAFLVLPPTLYLKDSPYFIYSQHYGECATDSFLNILFFADGYRNYFGQKADLLYRRLRREHRDDLLHYTPFFKSEVIRIYEITNGVNLPQEQFEQVVDIFARIVRRFIFVVLLNSIGFLTKEKISEIIETHCPLTVKRKNIGARRKSLNAMAGVSIHDAILEFLGEGRREKKNNNELVAKGLSTIQIVAVLTAFMKIVLAPRSSELYHQWHPFEQTEAIQPHLPFLKAIYLAPSAVDATKAWHAVAIFTHSGKWYLADNNLGITISLAEFDPLKYFGPGVLSQFFIFDFQNIRVRELLRGNNDVNIYGYLFDDTRYSTYTIERLQSATFYGFYVYVDGDKEAGAHQIIIAISEQNLYPCYPMKELFDTNQRLYFFSKVEEGENQGNTPVEELNPNLPGPMKRNRLKKTKRRPRGRGKNRWTQRAKPARANQTNNLVGQVENVNNASGNARNEAFNEHMERYFFRGKPGPKKFTLRNFL